MKHGFLILLVISLAVGWMGSATIGPVASIPGLRPAIVFAVLLIAGLTLQTRSVRDAVKHPRPTLVAIAINALGIPLLAAISILVLRRHGWSADWAAGLWVAAIAPCTLASAAVWTRRAGGNVAVAMMTTVVTNLACVVTIPLAIHWAPLPIAGATSVEAWTQVQKIALGVVLPMAAGWVIRQRGAESWIDRHTTATRVLSQMGILTMVAFGGAASAAAPTSVTPGAGISQAAESLANSPSEAILGSFWGGISALLLAAVGIHIAGLAIAWAISRLGGANRADAIAAAISGSQKTLMVGLQIAIDLGVSVLPMLIFHVAQLVIDTVVADRNRQRALKKQPGDA